MPALNNDEKWIGKKFARLTVIGIEPPSPQRHEWRWRCQCDCGNVIVVPASSVKSGNSKSCGCLKNEKTGERFRKFSFRISDNKRLYEIFSGMKKRCYNEKSKRYKDYGGRGIKICKEWMETDSGFDRFAEWAFANGYNETATIDRIDVNGDYEPGNCRWVTLKQQANNKRDTVWVDYMGEHIQLLTLCKRLGVPYNLVYYRMFSYGWPIERAIEEKSKQDNSLLSKCRKLGLSYMTVRDRILKLGWTEERALSTPTKGRGSNAGTYGYDFGKTICPVCGKEFTKNNGKQIYCGAKCRAISQSASYRSQKKQ